VNNAPFRMSRRFSVRSGAVGLAAVGAVAGASLATTPHLDIELLVENGVLTTGEVDRGEPGFPVTPGVRVFTAQFGSAADVPSFPSNVTNLPGFNAQGSLTPGSVLSFDITGPLRRWNEARGDFVDVSAEALAVSLFTSSVETPASVGEVVEGFNVATVSSSGSVHRHINYVLLGAATPGVYLYEMRLETSDAAVAPSDEVFVVFGMEADETELLTAESYVEGLLEPAACSGDATGDGAVNADDLLAVLGSFGESGMLPRTEGDIDGDRTVNADDLLAVLGAFGSACS